VTGDPVTVVRDGYDMLHFWAVLRFFLRVAGVDLPPRPRVVLLCALPSGLEYSARLRLLDDGALHRISLQRPRALARLHRVSPQVLTSDPAGLHWLAAQELGFAPRLILTSAQRFSPHQREGLPAPVINYYSTTETGPIAWECLRAPGRFHVLAPEVWVESLHGELVVTRLRASVLPLLRYRTGDDGDVEDGACVCGHAGQTIVRFAGRRACDLVTPSGARVDAWRLAWLFKAYPLRSFRLTQVRVDAFVLELVAAEVPRALVGALEEALVRLGWPATPRVEVRSASGFEEDGGKPEPFRLDMSGRGTVEAGR
jgi:phenylacetate-CoA ligase